VNEQQKRTMALTLVGAALGSVAAYLFLTPQGRETCRRIDSMCDDIAHELGRLRGTITKAKGAVNEGWRLLDDFGDVVLGEGRHVESGRYARPESVNPS
jgi:hypothetical protein